MAKSIKINVLNKTGILYSEEAESLNIKTSEGYRTILPDHIPFIASLGEGKMTIKGKKKYSLEVISGLLRVEFNEITIIIKEHKNV